MPPNVFMNHGRWLMYCPKCESPLPAVEGGIICPVCWPNIRARAFKQGPDGLFRPVADTAKVEQARAAAAAAGEIYTPVYPENRAEIERVLRSRKQRNMNWEPGESLSYLLADNIQHGDPVPGGLNGL